MRVIDTDAQSYVSHSVADFLVNAEEEKKRKYGTALRQRRIREPIIHECRAYSID